MKMKILVVMLVAVFGVFIAFQQASARLSARDNVDAKETITGDKFLKGQTVRNEGIVKGDLYLWGLNALSKGTVEGDVIGAGQDISVIGNVAGNIRIAAVDSTISGNVGKNVTVFAKDLNLTAESIVEGSMTVFAANVDIRGKVKGLTIISSRDVVLGGEFFGDVEVNQWVKHRVKYQHYKSVKTQLTVLPGTKIHGVLKFKGANADIQKGAEIKDFQWAKADSIPRRWYDHNAYRYLWRFIRLVFTIAVFFLLGLLLIRLFPAFAQSVDDCAIMNPGKSIGIGLVSVISVIGAAVICIVLLVLSLIMSPALGIVTTFFIGALYSVLFYLATLPAALWLGSLMFKDRSIQYRLGAGLIAMKGGLFILMVLAIIPIAGYAFSVVSVMVTLGIVLLGSGAIVNGAKTRWSA